MNGATIQERPCPRCAIRRTVRIARASFCFNCHLHWDGQWGQHSAAVPEPAYAFNVAETERLMVYRAAVRAGFYNDSPSTAAIA